MCQQERIEWDYSALSVPINTLDTIYEGTVRHEKVREQERE